MSASETGPAQCSMRRLDDGYPRCRRASAAKRFAGTPRLIFGARSGTNLTRNCRCWDSLAPIFQPSSPHAFSLPDDWRACNMTSREASGSSPSCLWTVHRPSWKSESAAGRHLTSAGIRTPQPSFRQLAQVAPYTTASTPSLKRDLAPMRMFAALAHLILGTLRYLAAHREDVRFCTRAS